MDTDSTPDKIEAERQSLEARLRQCNARTSNNTEVNKGQASNSSLDDVGQSPCGGIHFPSISSTSAVLSDRIYSTYHLSPFQQKLSQSVVNFLFLEQRDCISLSTSSGPFQTSAGAHPPSPPLTPFPAPPSPSLTPSNVATAAPMTAVALHVARTTERAFESSGSSRSNRTRVRHANTRGRRRTGPSARSGRIR